MLQVLTTMRSASFALPVVPYPELLRSSASCSESWTFIWQPKVRMKSFFVVKIPLPICCLALFYYSPTGGVNLILAAHRSAFRAAPVHFA